MTTPTDSNATLVQSIGLTVLGYVGKDHVRSLSVSLDVRDMTGQVELQLHEDSEDARYRAMGKLLDVEDLFMDEVALAFRFVDQDGVAVSHADSHHPNYVYA